MALSPKIRAICKLHRGTRSHKGTFELWSVNSTGNWHYISSLIMDSSSLSGQRERPWAHGIPPSWSRRPFGLWLAYYWNCFLIKKAIHVGRRGKVSDTMKSQSPSHPFLGDFPAPEVFRLPKWMWVWIFQKFTEPEPSLPSTKWMGTLHPASCWIYRARNCQAIP